MSGGGDYVTSLEVESTIEDFIKDAFYQCNDSKVGHEKLNLNHIHSEAFNKVLGCQNC